MLQMQLKYIDGGLNSRTGYAKLKYLLQLIWWMLVPHLWTLPKLCC